MIFTLFLILFFNIQPHAHADLQTFAPEIAVRTEALLRTGDCVRVGQSNSYYCAGVLALATSKKYIYNKDSVELRISEDNAELEPSDAYGVGISNSVLKIIFLEKQDYHMGHEHNIIYKIKVVASSNNELVNREFWINSP